MVAVLKYQSITRVQLVHLPRTPNVATVLSRFRHSQTRKGANKCVVHVAVLG